MITISTIIDSIYTNNTMFLSETGREYSHAIWIDHTVETFLLLLPFVNNVYVTPQDH